MQLKEKWLRELGFEKENEILIEQKKKKLIITVRGEKIA
ncbi:hypothetical protein [Winogradskyella sp.]